MDTKLTTWLKTKSGLTRNGEPLPHYLSREPSNLEVFSELIYKNGGKLDTGQFIKPQPGGPYGRIGLTSEELCLFLEMRGFASGILFTGEGTENELFDAIKNEIERVDSSVQVATVNSGEPKSSAGIILG